MRDKKVQHWRKLGMVIRPNKRLFWVQTHCMVPTPQSLGGGLVRVFFSGRDTLNRSHIGHATVDLNQNGRLVDYSTDPVLAPGALGCFDDNGVTPSCVVNLTDDELGLYYIGWNPGSTVRMNIFGGLAISKDGGETFERWSRAPILERNQTDPYFNTAPWVVRDGDGFRIFYVSCQEWRHKDLPRYNIKTGHSKDGKNWVRADHVCVDFRDETEHALARPYVIKEDGLWRMWFSHKNTDYRIGYAESYDGLSWERLDHLAGIDVSFSGFDSKMVEYGAVVVRHDGQRFMFYNGNDYGLEGIGLAVEE
ncbi:MAG: Uncharacterised protein [Gammaproteobacteria bacterium]|nr:MAG: Uncharacterised protein [Gammaproteobacteria bacterium]